MRSPDHLISRFDLGPTPDWYADAACRGCDPNLFFAEVGEVISEARQVCDACPVQQQCAELAIASPSEHGVWGGLSERERRQIRRRRRGQARGRSRIFVGDGDNRHGSVNGYLNLGCRCDPCREANAAYWANRDRRRKTTNSETPGAATPEAS